MRSFTVSRKASFCMYTFSVHDSDSELEHILTGDIAAGCKLLRNRFESKDREWASYTCVLGFHVMGEKSNMCGDCVEPLNRALRLMSVAVVFQVCGWRAPMAPTSTPCVALTVRGWWPWLMTSAKFTSSSTPVLNQRYRSH